MAHDTERFGELEVTLLRAAHPELVAIRAADGRPAWRVRIEQYVAPSDRIGVAATERGLFVFGPPSDVSLHTQLFVVRVDRNGAVQDLTQRDTEAVCLYDDRLVYLRDGGIYARDHEGAVAQWAAPGQGELRCARHDRLAILAWSAPEEGPRPPDVSPAGSLPSPLSTPLRGRTYGSALYAFDDGRLAWGLDFPWGELLTTWPEPMQASLDDAFEVTVRAPPVFIGEEAGGTTGPTHLFRIRARDGHASHVRALPQQELW